MVEVDAKCPYCLHTNTYNVNKPVVIAELYKDGSHAFIVTCKCHICNEKCDCDKEFKIELSDDELDENLNYISSKLGISENWKDADNIIPISAKKKTGIKLLRAKIKERVKKIK